jgi:diguanylate cyclase (GGDEF)-like protein
MGAPVAEVPQAASREPEPKGGVHLVLLAGLPEDLARRVQARLGEGVNVAAVNDPEAAVEAVRVGRLSVIVVDHDSKAIDGSTLIAEVAKVSDRRARVVACLPRGAGGEVPAQLVGDLGVDQIVFHPLDHGELARSVARLIGVPLAEDESAAGGDAAPLAAAVSKIWARHREQNQERIAALEDAVMAMLEGSLTTELRTQAEREAHKLAGSLGTFGLNNATTLARRIELALSPRTEAEELDPVSLSETVEELRREIERGPRVVPDEQEEGGLVVVSDDDQLTESLLVEGSRRGLPITVRSDSDLDPDTLVADAAAVIIDLGTQAEERLALLEALAGLTPAIPVIVVADSDSLDDRVAVTRRGARGFLARSSSASRIVEAAANLVARPDSARTSVLAVDDDPQVLDVLEAILRQHGVSVTGLCDPLAFWDALERTAPDALILDEDMPHLTGIELCRVVRADPRWAGLPVLFLTGHRDRDTIRRVFEAGADDFVAKPVIGPELVARLDNRLERTRLHRTMAETDPLTGLANRRKSTQGLQLLLGLAERRNEPVCVAVLDLDRFKGINDRHGHAVGDAVLRRLGQTLKRGLRNEDVVGRWGGEEFVIGLYGANSHQASERLRTLMSEFCTEKFATPSGELTGLTFSAGVAQWPNHGADLNELYRAADGAMYRAKQSGRARVLAPDPAARDNVDIAVVEDDEMLARLLVHALEARGYSIRWIADGEQASHDLIGPEAEVVPRLVLLDIDLPGLDGVALLRRLMDRGGVAAPRVIMLTVKSTEPEVLRSLELGAFDHLAKPVSVPVLMQKVRRALEP